MDDVRTPIYAAEPYQESQGRESPNAPDALVAFYKDMEQKEIVQRKLSKRKSNSIWSRKSVKRSTAPAASPTQKPQSQINLLSEAEDERKRGDEEREMERLEEQKDTVPQALNSPRSIIPDTAKDLPAWYNKETSSSLPGFKQKYNIHNPVGPRWYKNHHLIPPSLVKPATRPPSVFSPSFPPMASSTLQDRPEDLTRLPGPSRTPSNSPLPTPNSSQTRVEDAGIKPRSRKTSQTAHDNVDLLDVTDPWGTNWHHHSPYDIGLSNGPISVDAQDALQARTRRSSITTAQSRQKTVIPSPLSQSTSAVHLHDLDVGIHIPRKLNKRRMPTLGNIFAGQAQQSQRTAVSLPVTPVEQTTVLSYPPSSSVIPKPKRHSVALIDPPSQNNGMMSKKDKRGSALGRLMKKFSILRKPIADQWRSGRDSDWQSVNTGDAATDVAQQCLVTGQQPSAEKDQPDTTKRIPPPSLAPTKSSEAVPEADRSSSISLETPFSIGRLTIANPDVLGSSDNTPTQGALPLLPDKPERCRPSVQTVPDSSGPVDSDFQVPISGSGPRRTSISSSILTSEAQPPVVPEKTLQTSLPPISGSRERGSSEAPATTMSNSSLTPPASDLLLPMPPQKPKVVSTNSIRSYSHVKQSSKGDVQSPESRSRAPSSSVVDLPLKPGLSPGHNPSDRSAYNSPLSHPRSTSPSPSVSFPAMEAAHPRYPSDYSPLSAVSMLANPPTPCTADMSIPPSPEPLPSPLPPTVSQDRKRSSREPSPPSHMVRQTETFKLVRSSSNNVYASSETIVAGGQQWEVVESSSKGRTLSKSNDREIGSRRDQRREGRHATDEAEERHQARNHRSYKSPPDEHTVFNSLTAVLDSSNERPGISRNDRKKEDGGRLSERKRSPNNLDVNKPQPPPPPPTPGAPPARPLERQPSTSARPTSELPSAAEMNALRAKEAWDLERLWKARSVYGNESHEFSASTVPLTVKDEKGAQAAIHGSSHTAFVVQNPFQTQPSHIYHSMPTTPPPILYPSFIPSSSQPSSSSHGQSSKYLLQNFAPKTASPASRPPLTNPLPEPPRASSYEPAQLLF
ncbi:hypothetical protein L208DRAFT_495016 [Tricholoma matsutake]|nr:hypothetical protein L208DRAFT_495016 [Tricholoma matsutake 945]